MNTLELFYNEDLIFEVETDGDIPKSISRCQFIKTKGISEMFLKLIDNYEELSKFIISDSGFKFKFKSTKTKYSLSNFDITRSILGEERTYALEKFSFDSRMLNKKIHGVNGFFAATGFSRL
jgi:hypothetical protein